ncbi:MAG: hypothetical protein WDO15_11400 [Bacteroidota bacterium]
MEIDIGHVLNRIDDTIDEHSRAVKEFGLKFITSDGRCRTIRCRKNIKFPRAKRKESKTKIDRSTFNLKENGAILVGDLDKGEMRTIKIASIAFFRDHKKTEWHPVRF